MLSPAEKQKLNKALKEKGFGGLEDKTLYLQMAMCVRDHKHFQSILMKVEPDKRHICYQALSPHLRFKALTLEEYISQAKRDAEREQLPTYNPETLEIKPFEVTAIDTKLHQAAERILDRVFLEMDSKGHLNLTCVKCTKQEAIPGATRYIACRTAARWGWSVSGEQILCPECKADA